MCLLLIAIGVLLGVALGYYPWFSMGVKRGKAIATGEFFGRVHHDRLVFGNAYMEIIRHPPESVRKYKKGKLESSK